MTMRKGFSLFTPLVGTAVIILAVMMTSIMVLNDLRMARGLINSYEYSSEANAGALIKAAAQLQILQNIENTLNDYFNNTFSFSCPGTAKCEDEVDEWVNPNKDKMMGNKGEIARALFLGTNTIFSGVLGKIETVTDYTVSDPALIGGNIDDALNDYWLGGEMGVVEWGGQQPKVKFTTAALQGDPRFSVTFQKHSNTVTVSILPDDSLTYVYKKRVKNKFTQSAINFDYFLSNVKTSSSITWWRTNGCNTLTHNSGLMGNPSVSLIPVYDYNNLGTCTTISDPHLGTIVDSENCDTVKPISFFVTYKFTGATLNGKMMTIKYNNYSSAGINTINGKLHQC